MRNLVISAIIVFAMLSCSDSDNEIEEKKEVLLPKVVTLTQTYNNTPGIFTSIRNFNYDESGRPIEIADTYTRLLPDETEAVLQTSSTTTIVYEADKTIKMTSVSIYHTENNQKQTIIRTFKPDNNFVRVALNDNSTETIELENGLAIKYTGNNFIKSYQYDTNKNVSQFSYTFDSYTSINNYTYDKKEGVYKNINIPQWFFVVLIGDNGRINNIDKIDALNKNEVENVGSNTNTYNEAGYPVNIDFYPNRELIGINANQQKIEYIKVLISNTNQ